MEWDFYDEGAPALHIVCPGCAAFGLITAGNKRFHIDERGRLFVEPFRCDYCLRRFAITLIAMTANAMTGDREQPIRIEFFADTIESLRPFDPETQRSHGTLAAVEVVPLSDSFAPRSLVARLLPILSQRFAGHRELPALLERLEASRRNPCRSC